MSRKLVGLAAGFAALSLVAIPVASASSDLRKAPPTRAQTVELRGSNLTGGDWFGYTTAISGNTIAVGAPYHPGGGRVYVFHRSGSAWKQVQVLRGSDTTANDVFGVDVKVSGSELIIGADQAHGTGRAYIFVNTGGRWKQAAELGASDLTAGLHYGLSVAISGSNAIVGTEDDNHAYIYHKSGSHWKQSAEFSGTGQFGFWVGISGATAVVGADENSAKAPNAGAIYVYSLSGPTWKPSGRLTGTDTAASDHFGQNLAISGGTIVVNAPYHAHSAGRIYVFTKIARKWKETAELVGSKVKQADTFGWYVAISGGSIVAGTPQWQDPGTGKAYVFTGSGRHWKAVAILEANNLTAHDQFGAGVGISGGTAVVGAYTHVGGGAAYVFHV